MMDEFGLDDDSGSADESGSDGDDFNKFAKKNIKPSQQEFDKLQESVSTANQLKLKAEQRYERAQQKQLQVQRQSKQAKFLLMERHSKQIDALKDQLEEHKKMVIKDGNRTKKLQELFIVAKNGDTPDLSPASLFCDPLAETKKDNTKLRATLEELNSDLRRVKTMFADVEKDRDKYSKLLPADFVYESSDRLQVRLAGLVEELKECKRNSTKKRNEEKELKTKIIDLQQRKKDNDSLKKNPRNNTLSPAEQEKQRLREILAKIKLELTAGTEKEKESIVTNNKLKTACETVKKQVEAKEKELKAAEVSRKKEEKKREELMKAAANSKDETVDRLKLEKIKLDEKTKEILDSMKGSEGELNEIKDKAKDKLNEASDTIKKLKEEYGGLKTMYSKEKEAASKLLSVNTQLKNDIQKIVNAGSRRKIEAQKMLKQCAATKKEMATILVELNQVKGLVPQYEKQLVKAVESFESKQGGDNKVLMENYKKELNLRRKYFYEYQKLRGSIRVYVRVREVVGSVDADNLVRIPNDEQIIVKQHGQEPVCFEFDNKVITQKMNAAVVYEEVSDLIASVMDGLDVTIICYGPTNTGKTHTLTDGGNGLYHHCLKGLFHQAAEAKDTKFVFSIHMLTFTGSSVTDVVQKAEVKTQENEEGLELILSKSAVTEEKAGLTVINKGVEAFGVGNHDVGASRVCRIAVDVHNATLDRHTSSVLYIVDVSSEPCELSETVRAVVSAKAVKGSVKSLCKGSALMQCAVSGMGSNSKLALIAHVNPTDVPVSLETLNFAHGLIGKEPAEKKKKKGGK